MDLNTSANIPSNYARIIARELGLTLKEIPKLLTTTRITSDEFIKDDIFLTAYDFLTIIHNGITLSQNPAFGLSIGEKLNTHSHGMMGLLINHSPNLLKALEAYESFIPTRVSFITVTLDHTNEILRIGLKFNTRLEQKVQIFLTEACLMSFFQCAQTIIGRPLTEAKICFAYEAPAYWSAYEKYFNGQMQFSTQSTYVEISLELAYITNVSANTECYLLAMRECKNLLEQLSSPFKSYTYKVQNLILSNPLHSVSENSIAEMLFISKRTLRRKLTEEGTNFRTINNALKSQQASQYLRNTNLTVESIATMLDYHDTASFRRAFKKWFDLTPQAFRKLNKNTTHESLQQQS